MISKLVLLLVFVGFSTISGEEIKELSLGYSFGWYFPNEEEITFYVYVPTKNICHKNWEWVGVGIKPPNRPHGKMNGDIVFVYTQTGEFQDRYAPVNGYPPLDSNLGGRDDLREKHKWIIGGYTVFSWTRYLNTTDPNDIVLEPNHNYTLIWSKGMVVDGDVSQHCSREFGLAPFTLTYNDQPLDSGSPQSEFMITDSSAVYCQAILLIFLLFIVF